MHKMKLPELFARQFLKGMPSKKKLCNHSVKSFDDPVNQSGHFIVFIIL